MMRRSGRLQRGVGLFGIDRHDFDCVKIIRDTGVLTTEKFSRRWLPLVATKRRPALTASGGYVRRVLSEADAVGGRPESLVERLVDDGLIERVGRSDRPLVYAAILLFCYVSSNPLSTCMA